MNPEQKTQKLVLTFPAVPRDNQASLMTKMHALMCEMEDLYSVVGHFNIENSELR